MLYGEVECIKIIANIYRFEYGFAKDDLLDFLTKRLLLYISIGQELLHFNDYFTLWPDDRDQNVWDFNANFYLYNRKFLVLLIILLWNVRLIVFICLVIVRRQLYYGIHEAFFHLRSSFIGMNKILNNYARWSYRLVFMTKRPYVNKNKSHFFCFVFLLSNLLFCCLGLDI